jgi:hypothetical protein
MMLSWPILALPPINLWSFPVQTKRNVKLDNRARSLKLNPRPRPKKASQPIIEPAKGEVHGYEIARAMHCACFSAKR